MELCFAPDCTIHFIYVLNTERAKRARKKIFYLCLKYRASEASEEKKHVVPFKLSGGLA